MFGFRTPVKSSTSPEPPVVEETSPVAHSSRTANVRRSIGEWENGKPKSKLSPKKTAVAEPQKSQTSRLLPQEKAVSRRTSAEAAGSPPVQTQAKYPSRLAEARACVAKAKLNLGASRNTKTEIKTAVIEAIERLYQLIKEADAENGKSLKKAKPEEERKPDPVEKKEEKVPSELVKKIEEHGNLLRENSEKMDKLKETIEKHQEAIEKPTYASVAAAPNRPKPVEQTALHSIVVAAKNGLDTGEEVLNRIREVMKAKDGGITVERIRKAKESKVIIGCRSEEERNQVKERLKRAEQHLEIKEVKNKNPLVIIRDLLKYNTDDDILCALCNQNRDIFQDIDTKDSIEIVYKKPTRNPHTHHVVMRVAPAVWQRLIDTGFVRIDLQRARVADQSPLVQCSLCLGYGHGKRFCTETLPKCSHCGGPHMRAKCADWLAGGVPSCCNCMHAKIEKPEHNAFSSECSIRRRWDALARATIAYC